MTTNHPTLPFFTSSFPTGCTRQRACPRWCLQRQTVLSRINTKLCMAGREAYEEGGSSRDNFCRLLEIHYNIRNRRPNIDNSRENIFKQYYYFGCATIEDVPLTGQQQSCVLIPRFLWFAVTAPWCCNANGWTKSLLALQDRFVYDGNSLTLHRRISSASNCFHQWMGTLLSEEVRQGHLKVQAWAIKLWRHTCQ